LGNWILFTFKK